MKHNSRGRGNRSGNRAGGRGPARVPGQGLHGTRNQQPRVNDIAFQVAAERMGLDMGLGVVARSKSLSPGKKGRKRRPPPLTTLPTEGGLGWGTGLDAPHPGDFVEEPGAAAAAAAGGYDPRLGAFGGGAAAEEEKPPSLGSSGRTSFDFEDVFSPEDLAEKGGAASAGWEAGAAAAPAPYVAGGLASAGWRVAADAEDAERKALASMAEEFIRYDDLADQMQALEVGGRPEVSAPSPEGDLTDDDEPVRTDPGAGNPGEARPAADPRSPGGARGFSGFGRGGFSGFGRGGGGF